MKSEQDPLWYDREDADEPLGLLALLTFFIVVALERVVFFPAEIWLKLKLWTIAAFKDVTDPRS